MDLDIVNHRLAAKIARWFALAMGSTALALATEIWPVLAVLKWVALAVTLCMVIFIVGSYYLLHVQASWRNFDDVGDLAGVAFQFILIIAAVGVGVWIAS